jgi:hypothetical protein
MKDEDGFENREKCEKYRRNAELLSPGAPGFGMVIWGDAFFESVVTLGPFEEMAEF